MIVSPEMIKSSLTLLPSASSSVAPVPSVIPDSDPIYQLAGDVGNRTLWIVVVIMALSSLAFYGMAFRVPVQKRLFHILTAFITTFAFLSYFAMASGDGISLNKIVIKEVNKHLPDTEETVYRQVYWARYVDWSVTTPLLLLDLALMGGLSGANILVALVADEIMILTGLFAAFGSGDGQKWGWYTIACVAYLVIVYQFVFNGRAAVAGKDNKTKAFYGAIGAFTLILWTVYPIVWGVADGARIANVDTEILSYAVLDVLAKPVFGFWLLFTHDSTGKDNKTKAFYGAIGAFTLILWTVYPIVWGVADGARIANVDTEILSYAVLDVLAKPVFGFWLLFTHDSMASTSESIDGFWANGMGSQGTLQVGED